MRLSKLQVPRSRQPRWIIGTDQVTDRDTAIQRACQLAQTTALPQIVTDAEGYFKFYVTPHGTEWVLTDPREDAAWHNATN